jgi:hypothetical protein
MKSRSGKKVRVAATFTGAAACAFTFAPAAVAAVAQPAVAGPGQQAGAHPNILDKSCPGGTKHWLHLATTPGKDQCYNTGGYTVDFIIHGLCGGAHSGIINGLNASGYQSTIQFGPGNKYRGVNDFRAEYISVYSTTGNDSCIGADYHAKG